MTTTRSLTLTTTVWMVDRVHRDTTVGRTDTAPAICTGFTDGDVLMVRVANLANRCHALHQNPAGLARGQLQQGICALLRYQLRARSSRTHHLRALTRTKLNVVHRCTGGDVLERQSIANQNIGLWSAHDLLPNLQSNRLQDVAL